MKPNHMKHVLAALAVAAAGLVNAQQPEESVIVNTYGLPTYVAKAVEAKAQKGITPLRQYVQRTSFLHQLNLEALILTPEKAAAMKAEARDLEVQIAAWKASESR